MRNAYAHTEDYEAKQKMSSAIFSIESCGDSLHIRYKSKKDGQNRIKSKKAV